MKIPSDILQGCIKGKEKDQFKLYKLCYGNLISTCYRYLKNEESAVAALNLGFYKILKNLHKYNPEIPFIAWSKRIVINTVIDEYRKEKRLRMNIDFTDEALQAVNSDQGVDFNLADQQFQAEELLLFIKQLPPTTKRVFNLFAIDGYSHNEISELLQISVGTSKWHVSNARKLLQKMILTFQKNQPQSHEGLRVGLIK